MKEIIVTIEIPNGSNIKYEYDRDQKTINVDRILRKGFFYPANYGFIGGTLDWDGDELDVLIFSPEKFLPGSELKARIIGAMKMIDTGETDTKLIGVHADDYRLEGYQTMDDIPKKWLKDVETFFTTYKNWKKPGITQVSGFEGRIFAMNEYRECQKLMQKYGKLPKQEFLKKMRALHPEKYQPK